MNQQRRVKVMSNCKMVSLQGQPVRHEGEPVEMFGVSSMPGPVHAVKFDDGRELLVAHEDIEVLP